MKKTALVCLVTVLTVACVAVLVNKTTLAKGKFPLASKGNAVVCQFSLRDIFPSHYYPGKWASRVISKVTSKVPSKVTSKGGVSIVVSNVTSNVPSEVLVSDQYVKQCLVK